jgi:hypothetical protein
MLERILLVICLVLAVVLLVGDTRSSGGPER